MSDTLPRPSAARDTDEPCCPGAPRGRCKVGCPGPKPRPAHVTSTRTLDLSGDEQALIGHVRGWCHDGTVCALCHAQNRAFTAEQEMRQRAIRAEASVLTATRRRINADIATAQIARDLIEAEDRADNLAHALTEARASADRSERILDSIIEG